MMGGSPQDGEVRINRLDPSRIATFTNGVWVESHQAPRTAGADLRGRLNLGVAPMVQAQQDMERMQNNGGHPQNPLQKDWGATMLSGAADMGVGGFRPFAGLNDLAKKVGGQDYQDYTTAAKTFESQLMPIMSGAAVSPSEAERQTKAALPELGDSPETLANKTRTQKMMLNGAAVSQGLPIPYPDVPTYGINTNEPHRSAASLPSQPGAPAAGQPSPAGGGQRRVRIISVR